MNTDIFVAVIIGFFLGIGFTIIMTSIITWRVLSVLEKALGKKIKKRRNDNDNDDDEPANYWKPKGWKPDQP